jgi:hypothetical protein
MRIRQSQDRVCRLDDESVEVRIVDNSRLSPVAAGVSQLQCVNDRRSGCLALGGRRAVALFRAGRLLWFGGHDRQVAGDTDVIGLEQVPQQENHAAQIEVRGRDLDGRKSFVLGRGAIRHPVGNGFGSGADAEGYQLLGGRRLSTDLMHAVQHPVGQDIGAITGADEVRREADRFENHERLKGGLHRHRNENAADEDDDEIDGDLARQVECGRHFLPRRQLGRRRRSRSRRRDPLCGPELVSSAANRRMV